jgi:hypothetical protein
VRRKYAESTPKVRRKYAESTPKVRRRGRPARQWQRPPETTQRPPSERPAPPPAFWPYNLFDRSPDIDAEATSRSGSHSEPRCVAAVAEVPRNGLVQPDQVESSRDASCGASNRLRLQLAGGMRIYSRRSETAHFSCRRPTASAYRLGPGSAWQVRSYLPGTGRLDVVPGSVVDCVLCKPAKAHRGGGGRGRLGDRSQPPGPKRPGRAFEPCGLPDLPGLNFIWPNRLATARLGTTTWTLHPGTLRKCHPADSGKARYSPDENRSRCSGPPAHCCYGWQNARSTLDC